MLQLTVFDRGTLKVRSQSYEGIEASGCAVALPGANAVHFHLVTSDEPSNSLCLEVKASNDLPFDFSIRWSESLKDLQVDVGKNRPYFILPGEALPKPPIVPQRQGKLDLVLLVDATAKALKAGIETWKIQVDKLIAFVEGLHGLYPDLRIGHVSFADEPMGELAHSHDLTPQPNSAVKISSFGTLSNINIGTHLKAIGYSSGGDYVDALGDALERCGKDIQWRPNARKMLVLIGDSPGHSLTDPLPSVADARPRRADVDVEALTLHEMGVEILTIFAGLANEEVPQSDDPEGSWAIRLAGKTREQYKRLASLSQWAYGIEEFDPHAACEAVTSTEIVAIGREACYPVLHDPPCVPAIPADLRQSS